MRIPFARVLLAVVLCAGPLGAQSPNTGAAPAPATDDGRPVSWPKLPGNLLKDQGKIWTFPVQLARGKHLWPTLAVVGVTAALIATDAHTAPTFRNTTVFRGFDNVFTSNATDTGIAVAPAALYAAGLIARKSHLSRTALLAAEAFADCEVVDVLAKDIDRRRRPASYPPGTNMSDSWFSGQGSWVRGNGSFPSGHTIAAFSIATVIARRYPDRPWVRYASYGLASVVAFSRLTLSAHFPSDVLMGGAMGYSISRFVVLRQ